MTEVVFPNDTNPMGFLNGGRLLQWMDTACAIAAQRHSGSICVTVGIDAVRFEQPAKLGDIILITAKLTRVFNTSMEILADARAHRTATNEEFAINSAYFTFVALNKSGDSPITVSPLQPVTEIEKKEFELARQRKEQRK